MNIKEAKIQIADTLRAYLMRDELGNYLIPPVRQRPVLLMGPPGIGKTQIMEQIAAEEGVGLVSYTITHHTRQSAIGLPFIEKREYEGEEFSVTEYTMSEIIGAVYSLMEKTGLKEGILFLDEINCVSETLAPMMLQFLQCKTFGNRKLPEGWLIVAAGNPPEYNRSVRDFDVVTLDRVKRMNVEEDYGVWKEYAVKKGLHGAVISYLDIKKDNFYRIQSGPDGIQFATARGWEDLSEILFAYEKLGFTAGETVVCQYIQLPEIARDFANYLYLYYKYQRSYHVEEILAGTWSPVTAREFAAAPFDEKISVMGLLLSRLSESSHRLRLQDAFAGLMHPVLLSIKEPGGCKTLAGRLEEIAARERESLKRLSEAGQGDREARILRQRMIKALDSYLEDLAAAGDVPYEEAFQIVRERFRAEVDERERLASETGLQFDGAFRFLESSVGDSQELVLFVTEITAGFDTSWFIENYGCDAYYRHNRELLFSDRRREIIGRITSQR